MKNTPDARYLGELSKSPGQLVFISGCHRSGTSMLHHLLAYSGRCDYLSVYDILNYGELISNRVAGREAEARASVDAEVRREPTRGLDNLPVRSDTPEEYRFLLPPLPRPWYLSPSRQVEKLLFAPQLKPDRLEHFLEVCRKKRYLEGGTKPLILKNPNDHYFNFAAIHRMLPESKMIFVHRHPLHILNSYIVAFGNILDKKSEYFARLDNSYRTLMESPFSLAMLRRAFRGESLPRYIAATVARSYRYYLEQIPSLPAGSFISVRYEDMCSDAETHLAKVARFLQLEGTLTAPVGFVAPRMLKVQDHLLKAYEDHVSGMKDYLEQINYNALPG